MILVVFVALCLTQSIFGTATAHRRVVGLARRSFSEGGFESYLRSQSFQYAGAVSKNLNSEQFSSPIARALTAYVETRSLTRTFNNFAKPATVRQMSIRSRIRGPMVRIKPDANCGSSSRWRLRAPDLKAVSILFWTGRSRICTVSAHAAKHYGVTEDLYAMRVS
jgi:hypothetical protein